MGWAWGLGQRLALAVSVGECALDVCLYSVRGPGWVSGAGEGLEGPGWLWTGQGPSEARPVPGRLEEPCCCQEDGAGGSPRPGQKLLALQGGWGHAAPLHRPWVCFQGPGSCGLGSGRVA